MPDALPPQKGDPAARPAERPFYTEAQLAEIAETREWIAGAAKLTEEDIRRRQPGADTQMRDIWAGIDPWKLAAAIAAGDLHHLPTFVAEIAARDTRAEVRTALARDTSRLETDGDLSARNKAYLEALGISGDETLRRRAYEIGVHLFARARGRIEAKERPPLDPDETRFAAFVAGHIPTDDAIKTLLYFAAASPEVATALMDNPLLKNFPDNGARPYYVERLQGVLRRLLESVKKSNGAHLQWKEFLLKADALSRGIIELKQLGDEVERAIRLTPHMVQNLIEDPAIPDKTIQRIVSIHLIRTYAKNFFWIHVWKSLRTERYFLFRGVMEKETRAHGSPELIAFLNKPFGGRSQQ